MDRQTRVVFAGIMRLSPSQQSDLIDAWNAYNQAPVYTKRAKREEFRVVLGPVTGGCPCCGS